MTNLSDEIQTRLINNLIDKYQTRYINLQQSGADLDNPVISQQMKDLKNFITDLEVLKEDFSVWKKQD